jgi:hypothetical protein
VPLLPEIFVPVDAVIVADTGSSALRFAGGSLSAVSGELGGQPDLVWCGTAPALRHFSTPHVGSQFSVDVATLPVPLEPDDVFSVDPAPEVDTGSSALRCAGGSLSAVSGDLGHFDFV